MALLEEEGLIHAPHTSAGRVPTDAGYRVFVDRLSAVKPLSAGERRAISQFLEGAVDLDDVVDRTVRLLASLTRQVAVVQYPSLTRSTVRHIELVPVGATHLMVILIVNTGRVEQRVVEVRAAAHRQRWSSSSSPDCGPRSTRWLRACPSPSPRRSCATSWRTPLLTSARSSRPSCRL